MMQSSMIRPHASFKPLKGHQLGSVVDMAYYGMDVFFQLFRSLTRKSSSQQRQTPSAAGTILALSCSDQSGMFARRPCPIKLNAMFLRLPLLFSLVYPY